MRKNREGSEHATELAAAMADRVLKIVPLPSLPCSAIVDRTPSRATKARITSEVSGHGFTMQPPSGAVKQEAVE